MYDEVMSRSDADVVIMAAAVSDYTPSERASHKLKKTEGDTVLHLERTRDILRELGERRRDDQVLVGFAMETEKGLEHARHKLEAKNVDWIVLNLLTEDSGFGVNTNRITILGRDGTEHELPLMSKQDAAEAILDRLELGPSPRAA